MLGKKTAKLSKPTRRAAAGFAGLAWCCLSPAALAVEQAFQEGPGGAGEAVVALKLAQVLFGVPSAPSRRPSPTGAPDLPMPLRPSRSLEPAAPAPPVRDPEAGAIPENGSTFPASGKQAATTQPEGKVATGDPEPGKESVRWTIPPIRWGGSSGYSFQRSTSSGGGGSLSQAMFSNLSAASYIYAPWAATVTARIGMTTGWSDSGAGAAGGSTRNRTDNVVGGGDLNIFPASRFPFQAYFDRSDSRASGNLVSSDYTNDRYGVRQSYRAPDGVTSAGFQLDRSVVNSVQSGQDSVTALSGSFATDIGIVRNSLSGRYSLGERKETGEKARLLGFNTSHTANLEDNINLSGNFNYVDNTIQGANSLSSFSDARTRFIQAGLFGTWMPEFEDREDLPLSLSGGLRYNALQAEFAGQTVDSRGFGANVNALYRFSNNLSAGANAGINQISSGTSNALLLTTVGASVNYVGDPLTFGNYSYNWNLGSSANWQSSAGDIPASAFFGAQAGHSLSRYFAVSDSDTLSVSLSQTATVAQNQTLGASTSLAHSAAASYGLRWGEQFTGNATASLSDTFTSGANAQHFRMLSLGFYGLGQLSPLSSANVNLQFNWTDQDSILQFQGFQANTNSQHMTLLGSAAYTHARFLGYRGLRYNLLFTADTRLRDDRLLGDANGIVDRTRWTLTNRLDYRIGLLDFRLSLALNDVGGKKNALLFFQASRQFGAY